MDISRYIDGPLYWIITLLIERLWGVNRYLMLAALQIDKLNEWLVANAGDLLEIVAAAAQTPAMMAVTIAITLYGLWKTLSSIMPDLAWKPVDLSKVIVYLIGMSLFFSAPAVTMVAVDQLRTTLAAGLQADIFTTLSIDLAPDGFTSSEPPIPLSSSVTTNTGAVGIRLGSSLLLVTSVDEFGSKIPPQDFLDIFIPNDTYEFNNLSADDRTDALGVASTGIGLYSAAPMVGFFAIAEVLLWTVLNIVVLILWIGLPIALIFSPFTASEGIFKTFVSRYVGVIIETFVSVVLMGIVNTALIYAGTLGLGMLIATILLSGVVVVWRISSALKLTRTAIDTIGGASVTGGMTLSQGASKAAAGVAAVAGLGVVAVGGMGLGLTYADGQGRNKNRNEAEEGQYQHNMDRFRRVSAAGGYLMGHSSTASNALGKLQEARLISGMHNPARDGTDGTDAAYMGSRLSGASGNSAAYMTTSMMGGPSNAFEKMGYPVSGNGNGKGKPNGNDWVDEEGNGYDQGGRSGGLGRSNGAGRKSSASNGSNGNSSNGAGEYSDLPQKGWTDSSGRNSFGSNGKAKQAIASNQGHQSGGDGNANVKPDVDFNPAEAKQLDNWVSQVRKDHLLPGWGSAAGNSRSIEGAKAHYHPKAGDVANIIENNEAKDVKGAIGAIRSKVADYKQQGLSNSAITDKFSSGEAFNEIAQSEGTELSKNRDNMTTLADFTLRPTSEYSGQQIVSTLGKAINDPNVETPSQVNGFVNSQMGTDSNLGSYTGPVRGVVATAREMGVNGAQVENAYAMYSAGNTEGAWSELAAGTNSSPQNIGKMMQQFKAIPSSATMARSTKAIALPPTGAIPKQPAPQAPRPHSQPEVSGAPIDNIAVPEEPEFPPDLPKMSS